MVYLPAGDLLQLKAQMAEILALVKAPKANPSIIGRAQAISYAGKRSTSAFDRWCAKYGVKPVAHGRYSRRSLDNAIRKEEGNQ